MNDIFLKGLDCIPRGYRTRVKSCIHSIVDASGLEGICLNVVFVDDVIMRDLNQKWRGINTTTDVLSFSAQEGEPIAGAEHILGDIVISIDQAQSACEKFGHLLQEEVGVLLCHGILHLIGLDHERSEEEARMQAECEMSILDKAGLSPELCLLQR